jgi:uncharacterized cupredoxin-like copper-binding protein
VLAALSTGHKVGMLIVAGVFIVFALASSFLFPRYWPQFPGPRGRNAYIVVCLALFVSMILAVEFFAVEEEEAEGAEPAAAETTAAETGSAARTITVAETEFKIELPSASLDAGAYVFELENKGKVGHDLEIEGGAVEEKTPVIGPGETAKLEVNLEPGDYELYCTVPGHRDAGMETELSVS